MSGKHAESVYASRSQIAVDQLAYVDEDKIPDEFSCPICLLAVNVPVMAHDCGKLFCHSCLNSSRIVRTAASP